MNKHDFNDWYSNKFEDNAIAYAEKMEEEFEEFCFQRFTQLGVDKYEE